MFAKEQLPAGLKVSYRAIKTPEARKEFLAVYYYIKRVSEDFDVKVSEAELMDIFGIDPKTLPTKVEINKRLFEIAKSTAAKARAVADFDPTVVSSATAAFFNKNSTKDQLLRSLRGYQNSIQNYQSEIKNLVKSMFQTQSEIAQMEAINTSDLFVREMNKIISSNRFEQIYFYTQGPHICALSKPVTLKYAEKEYFLGQFVIAFNCTDKRFSVYPYKDNINAEGLANHYHPHIFEAKDICWGNAGASYSELMGAQKIGDLFLIADMILHSYNYESPINEINRFNRNPTPVGKTGLIGGRINEMPLHIQTLMDWFPALEKDSTQFSVYISRYINIHNFSYTWPSTILPEVPETPEPSVEEQVIVLGPTDILTVTLETIETFQEVA